MYEDLLLALQYVQKYEDDPMINMFNTTQMARDCSDALIEINAQLARVAKERDRYRNDSIVLSLMLLCDAGRSGRLPAAGENNFIEAR